MSLFHRVSGKYLTLDLESVRSCAHIQTSASVAIGASVQFYTGILRYIQSATICDLLSRDALQAPGVRALHDSTSVN